MKNKICTARDANGNLQRGEYTGYSEQTKKHYVSFYNGSVGKFDSLEAITFESVPIFETGATSSAVNELILYTDNTKELAEIRDKMYVDCLQNTITEYIDFVGLCATARSAYRKEMGAFFPMSLNERKEYCQIYANRFADWKKEKECNNK